MFHDVAAAGPRPEQRLLAGKAARRDYLIVMFILTQVSAFPRPPTTCWLLEEAVALTWLSM